MRCVSVVGADGRRDGGDGSQVRICSSCSRHPLPFPLLPGQLLLLLLQAPGPVVNNRPGDARRAGNQPLQTGFDEERGRKKTSTKQRSVPRLRPAVPRLQCPGSVPLHRVFLRAFHRF